MHREILKGKDYTFELKKYDNDIQLVPTSATITIVDNSGSSVVAETACSISASGIISYTFLAADNDTDDINFKITWKWVYASKTYYEYELFDVVLTPLKNITTDEDLFQYVNELRNNVFEMSGKSSSIGTTATLVDTSLTRDTKLDYKGGKIKIYVTDTTDHEALITSYSNGTVTFTPVYSTAIPADTNYIIRRSYSDIINTAWNNHVYKLIRNKNRIASGYIDSNILKNLTVYKALALICFDAMEIENDKWHLRALKFEADYQSEVEALYEPYDNDLDGNIDDREDSERPDFSSVEIQL